MRISSSQLDNLASGAGSGKLLRPTWANGRPCFFTPSTAAAISARSCGVSWTSQLVSFARSRPYHAEGSCTIFSWICVGIYLPCASDDALDVFEIRRALGKDRDYSLRRVGMRGYTPVEFLI